MGLSPDTSTTYHSSTFLHRDTPLPATTMCVCVLFYVKGHVGLLLHDIWLLKVFCARHACVCAHNCNTDVIYKSVRQQQRKTETEII